MAHKIAIIGAGAAGLMAAIEAGKKGHHVHVFDTAKLPAQKIRISGGGRCNFTNKHCTHENFISQNPHFCKSPLSRYPASDFISMVERHDIAYHEKQPNKETGQLFCDGSAQQIIDMLVQECEDVQVRIYLETAIDTITKNDRDFTLHFNGKNRTYDKVIIATGGPSIPKMGASDFGYRVARQFGHKIVPTTPALVPLTFTDDTLKFTKTLSGLSIDSVLIRNDSRQKTKNNRKIPLQDFKDDLLFTHRGLSGPAILQISSYWKAGETLSINHLPNVDIMDVFKKARADTPKKNCHKFLTQFLASRLVDYIFDALLDTDDRTKTLGDFSDKKFQTLADHLHNWIIKPNGSEGYRTAEVTLGGVDTNEIDNKTFESKKCEGLYFIGEVVDVTGHLGGHNFQWAWASGYCCGSEI